MPAANTSVRATTGQWLYLNGPGGIDDPLPSIRMESLRDGLDDYDLVHIALEYQAELEKAGKSVDSPAAEVLETLRRVPNSYVSSWHDYCLDPLNLETLRGQLAEYISSARKALGRTVSTAAADND